VDDDATPGDVFWDEMERQKVVLGAPSSSSSSFLSSDGGGVTTDETSSSYTTNGSGGSPAFGLDIDAVGEIDNIGGGTAMDGFNGMPQRLQGGGYGGGGGGGGGWDSEPTRSTRGGGGGTMSQEQAAEATLASYEAHMVSDNWLHDGYNEFGDEDFDMEDDEASLDRQIDEWEGEDGDGLDRGGHRVLEPWDLYVANTGDEGDDDDRDNRNVQIDMDKARSGIAKEFLFHNEDEDDTATTQKQQNTISDDQDAIDEATHLQQISETQLHSRRLENARRNPKASAYFKRAPNEIEGYDTMWVSAIDNSCIKNLRGSLGNYGVEFADNFGDWVDGCAEDAFKSIEQVASYKARQVWEVTGLPCIASRTSFEIEPGKVPEKQQSQSQMGPGSPGMMNRGYLSPRVLSGYRFNDVGLAVDYVVDALKPLSEPTRVTRFRSCYCFYDGEMEIFDYGELDCDLYYCNSLRTFIPTSFGIKGISQTLQLTFGLEYEGWMKKKLRDIMQRDDDKATVKLRDRVLKDGRVLPNDIIDVSAFMDSKVDVNLMDDCAKELSNRLGITRPTKILTVAATGLIIAIPMAKYLQVPVVYARKERSNVMSDTWQASYSSDTVGKSGELIVSKEHIDPNDRIIVIDDFLSSGSSQEALLRIVLDSGAKVVGVGVLLEKVYDSGRRALAGFDVPIESLVRVASVSGGVIRLIEEDGFSGM